MRSGCSSIEEHNDTPELGSVPKAEVYLGDLLRITEDPTVGGAFGVSTLSCISFGPRLDTLVEPVMLSARYRLHLQAQDFRSRRGHNRTQGLARSLNGVLEYEEDSANFSRCLPCICM